MPQYAAVDEQSQPNGEAPTLRPLDPRVRRLWWTQAAIVALLVCLVAVAVDLLVELPVPRGVLTGGTVLVAGVAAVALPVARYRRWRYALRHEDLWIRHGVWWLVVTVVPLARLQFVDTRQGPLDRAFGLSQLVVHTASSGATTTLPGLDSDEAEGLRDRLAAAAPEGAGV